MLRSEVEAKVAQAIRKLHKKDWFLLCNKVYEVCVAHRLALYLQPLFPGWDVDIEYDLAMNSHGVTEKEIDNLRVQLVSAGLNHRRSTDNVRPDIIIHKRGEADNLLVIEIKKKTSTDNRQDKIKLGAFTKDPFKYEHGLLVHFQGEQQESERLTWYVDGLEDVPS